MQTFLEILDVTLCLLAIFGFALFILHAREMLEICTDIVQELCHKFIRWWKKITKKE